jgi:hypothetical protein
MGTHRLYRMAVTSVMLVVGMAASAWAGDTGETNSRRPACSTVEVMTPLGIRRQVVCDPRSAGGLLPPMQRYPAPLPRSAWPLQYPPLREIGLHASGNLVTSDSFGMGGVSYTRSLTDVFALEGTVDATHRAGDVVGFAALRAVARQYHPEVGEVFLALGVARGFSGGDAARYPHGAGFVIGTGMQPRFSSHAAGRLEAQLVSFSHEMVGLRLTTGILIGFD